jgi:hypothetical protein
MQDMIVRSKRMAQLSITHAFWWSNEKGFLFGKIKWLLFLKGGGLLAWIQILALKDKLWFHQLLSQSVSLSHEMSKNRKPS